MWFTEIDLSRMRGRYLLITANNSEYEMDSNAIIISTSSRIKENSDEDGKYVPSGVVILCSCILDDQINNTGWKWGHRYYDVIHQSKKSWLETVITILI